MDCILLLFGKNGLIDEFCLCVIGLLKPRVLDISRTDVVNCLTLIYDFDIYTRSRSYISCRIE